ncbi:ATP-binding cassette sub-family A member 17-like [Anguilla anguilla]|uniref:ATP-binding cassette sub-family A member 17-like n=1 Tax=Anguilla anguilla TaxID=7936 RepID=UPI0015A89274|nr:ATP-binding cassette sub-family A member 17-like [Anguilla anguilla]
MWRPDPLSVLPTRPPGRPSPSTPAAAGKSGEWAVPSKPLSRDVQDPGQPPGRPTEATTGSTMDRAAAEGRRGCEDLERSTDTPTGKTF